jgi:hypothetical protein
MRNDYPDHPAGPIPDPDPGEVLEIGRPRLNAWVMLICGGLMLFCGVAFAMTKSEVRKPRLDSQGREIPPPPPFDLIGIGFGLMMTLGGLYLVNDQTVVVRLRPDGVEFPAEKLPPLRWDEIAEVDIATLVLIGAGGPQDYLGIKIRPGVLPEGSSPYSTALMQAARRMAGWDFDVCISQNNVGLCPAHLAMQMRARLEAAKARGENPPPPPDLPSLQVGVAAAATRELQGRMPRSPVRVGCALFMGVFGLFTAMPGILVSLGIIETPAEMVARGRTFGTSLTVGLLIAIVGVVFVWPWPDDEDEG